MNLDCAYLQTNKEISRTFMRSLEKAHKDTNTMLWGDLEVIDSLYLQDLIYEVKKELQD